MNFTHEERFAVAVALTEMSARHRQAHGGDRLFEKLPGQPFTLTPAQMEKLAQRIEDEGSTKLNNLDLVS